MKILTVFLLMCSILFGEVFDFETIKSDFKQTITNEENSTITYEGTFYATSKDQALWKYKKPIEKSIYFNKNQVVIIEPELEQAIITDLQNTPNITKLLKNSKKIDKNTYQTSYDEIIYNITTKNNTIQSISYKDKLENKVTIHLFNQQKNIILDDNLFFAKIPMDFDVITQ